MGNSNSISIIIAGDFLPPLTNSNIYSEKIIQLLSKKDFSIVNLEAPITNSLSAIKTTGKNFRVLPEAAKHIKEGYFDAVTLSNNHIRDYDDEGIQDTLRFCKQQNIHYVGAGNTLTESRKPLRITVKGKKIAFLNYSEREFNIASDNQAGANPFNSISAYYDLQKEKLRNDYLIVLYHGGLEYQYYPTMAMIENFKFLVDIGADAVIAHHTHRYSGSKMINGKPVLFGLGNFVFPKSKNVTKKWLIGLVLKLILHDNSISYELIPVEMSKTFDYINLLEEKEAKSILMHIDKISAHIEDNSFMEDYWQKHDALEKARIVRLLKSNSRLEYRIRKYFPKFFRNRLSGYKQNTLLNLIRCDSHRERIIRVLHDDKRYTLRNEK